MCRFAAVGRRAHALTSATARLSPTRPSTSASGEPQVGERGQLTHHRTQASPAVVLRRPDRTRASRFDEINVRHRGYSGNLISLMNQQAAQWQCNQTVALTRALLARRGDVLRTLYSPRGGSGQQPSMTTTSASSLVTAVSHV